MTHPSPSPSAQPKTALQQFKVLAFALMGAPLFIAVALQFALSGARWESPDLVPLLIVVVAGVAAAVLVPVLGYRLPALTGAASSGDTSREAVQRFSAAMILRFTICEAPVLLAVAMAFITEAGGMWIVLVGVVIGEALMARHIWPGEHAIGRSEQALEAGGARSGLRDALNRPAGP